MKNPIREGNTVLVLTSSYHWTGRVVEIGPYELCLDDAMMFLNIGQAKDAVVGKWSGAHGDPIPSGQIVAVPRPPASQVIDYVGELPRKQLRG